MTRVGLARGDESYQTVRKALDQIAADVQIPTDRPIVIKPNMVATSVELAATPVGAVRATMDVLTALGAERFIISNSSSPRAQRKTRATPGRDSNAMHTFP
jgi:hypothetical protein